MLTGAKNSMTAGMLSASGYLEKTCFPQAGADTLGKLRHARTMEEAVQPATALGLLIKHPFHQQPCLGLGHANLTWVTST